MTQKQKGPRQKPIQKTEQEINEIIDDISRQIIDNTGLQQLQIDIQRHVRQKQRNSTNPRLPFPFKQELKNNQQAPNSQGNANNYANYLNRPKTGCQACRKRLWDPI